MVAIKTASSVGVNLHCTKEKKAFSSLDPQMLGCEVQLRLYYSTSSIGVIFLSWTALHVHTRLLFVFLKDGTSQLGLSSYFSVCLSLFPFLTFLTPHKGRERSV